MKNLTELETRFITKFSWIDEMGYWETDVDFLNDPTWKGVFGSLVKKGVIEVEEERGDWETLYVVAREYEDMVLYNASEC